MVLRSAKLLIIFILFPSIVYGAAIQGIEEGSVVGYCKSIDFVGGSQTLTNTGLDCTLTSTAGSSGGDVESVGNCSGGACLDGTSDGGTNILFYDAQGATTLQGGDTSGAVALTLPTTTGTFALLNSPSFTTPTLGVASATSVNKVAITAPETSATLTIADGKTLTVTNTVDINLMIDERICNYEGTGTQINCDIAVDASGTCAAGSICVGGHTHPTTEISGVNAGTDLTSDLEEEVTEGSLADSVIVSADIKDGTIVTGDIAADTITHANIADADQADTKCIYIEDPTADDDLKSIWVNKTANDFLITELWCESDQTVDFDMQVDDGSPADVNGTDIQCAAGEAEDTSLSGDTTVAAGEELDLAITSVASAPTWVSICFTGNWVD